MVAHPKVRFLATDIWDAPDDDKRYEVIDGKLYVNPAPDWMHQYALGALFTILSNWVRSHRLGKIVQAPVGVILNVHNGVEPDIVYITHDQEGVITKRGVEGAPDLIVEALSPSTEARDRGIKMRRYAASGVPHYWLLDIANRSLEAYRPGKGAYERVGVFASGATFEPALFPGLQIPIAALWE